MNEILGQIFGIIALIVTIVCYQFNTQKKILISQIAASCLFILNLALLGALSGALMNVHGICRALVYYQKGKHKWAESSLWVIFFITAAAVITLLTFESWVDILPFVGTVFTTISLSMTDAAKIRLLTLPSPPCWLTYHLMSGNIGGTLNEVFVICSIVVGMIRLDRKKK